MAFTSLLWIINKNICCSVQNFTYRTTSVFTAVSFALEAGSSSDSWAAAKSIVPHILHAQARKKKYKKNQLLFFNLPVEVTARAVACSGAAAAGKDWTVLWEGGQSTACPLPGPSWGRPALPSPVIVSRGKPRRPKLQKVRVVLLCLLLMSKCSSVTGWHCVHQSSHFILHYNENVFINLSEYYGGDDSSASVFFTVCSVADILVLK